VQVKIGTYRTSTPIKSKGKNCKNIERRKKVAGNSKNTSWEHYIGCDKRKGLFFTDPITLEDIWYW